MIFFVVFTQTADMQDGILKNEFLNNVIPLFLWPMEPSKNWFAIKLNKGLSSLSAKIDLHTIIIKY